MTGADRIRAKFADRIAAAQDIEAASLQLQSDMKYPVDAEGTVFFIDYMHPDLVPTLIHHLIRLGWRKDESKALAKPRRVHSPAVPADFVTYVPIDADDSPLVIEQPPEAPRPELWSVGPPVVNTIDQERPPE